MANVIYANFKKLALSSAINFNTDTIKVALVTSAFTPNATTQNYYSDVTNEVSGAGYTTGGTTIAGGTVTLSVSTAVYSGSNVTWGTSTITSRAAVLYKSTGTASNSPLVAYIDFTTDQISSSGDFTIQWNANGIINLA